MLMILPCPNSFLVLVVPPFPFLQYVDEGYSGNGPSEYKFYDRHSNRWDTSGCKDGERCVAMDCHLPDSHFSLLAFFKEPQYDEFFEQLLQYQGDCLWTDDEYNFMQAYSSARNLLPITAQQGCIGTYLMDGQDYIYYNLKPAEYGELGIGIYTDADCIVEYKGTNLTPQTLLQKVICDGASYQNAEGDNGNGDDDEADALYQQICATSTTTAWSLSSDLNTWNDAFDVFKQCQPCMTFDLTSVVAGLGYKKNSKGDRYTAIQNLNGGQEVFTCQSVQQNSYEDLDDQAAAEQDDDQFQPINQVRLHTEPFFGLFQLAARVELHVTCSHFVSFIVVYAISGNYPNVDCHLEGCRVGWSPGHYHFDQANNFLLHIDWQRSTRKAIRYQCPNYGMALAFDFRYPFRFFALPPQVNQRRC